MLTEQSPARQRNAMLAVLLVGAFLMLLAETFFNNALPTIIATYRVSQLPLMEVMCKPSTVSLL